MLADVCFVDEGLRRCSGWDREFVGALRFVRVFPDSARLDVRQLGDCSSGGEHGAGV